ncbi:DUF3919 family protein [Clostridium tarantellae]|uniref:DUF3919 family protein n=1 Tax=Clostridium tarantellae TaxID=39493 RepID=A0A6I1MS13_9CLOT|nr:DUF3919 family protein [Clostridium tarantellae]MPQ43069.1 DUF3919 family protein [Clostridium tarantellae]
MKKVLKKSIYIYIFMIMVCYISYYYMNNIIYNNVKIVSTGIYNKAVLSTNIPEQIVIKNENLGEQIITNKLIINNVLKNIREICKGNKIDINLEKDSKAIKLFGEIIYSDNIINKFKIDNILEINGQEFYSNTYLINELRNMMVENLYCYDNILNIISKENNKIVYYSGNNKIILSKEQKLNLINNLKQFKVLSDNKEFLNMDLKETSKFNFRIYLDKNKMNNTENSIFLDVYKEYIIFQYLGDENGKKVYIKGELDEKNFK